MLTAQARVLLPRAYIKPRHGSDMLRSLSTDEAETGDSEGLSLVSDGRGSMAEHIHAQYLQGPGYDLQCDTPNTKWSSVRQQGSPCFLAQSLSFQSGEMESMLFLCPSTKRHKADKHVHKQGSRQVNAC